MKGFLRAFVALTLIAYAVGSVGFCVLFYGLNWELTFGILYRMPLYQYEHPFQYVAVVAIPYGFLGALWVAFLGHTTGVRRWLGLTGVILGTVLIASPVGGLLWELHDMQAGFFPPRNVMIANFEEGAWTGLTVGPLLLALSLPLNLVSLWIGLAAPLKVGNYLRHFPA